MRGRHGQDAFQWVEVVRSVTFRKARQEAGQTAMGGWDVPADLDFTLAEFARYHLVLASACRSDRAKFRGEPIVKFSVNPAEEMRGANIRVERFLQAAFDESLHLDVGPAFLLECSQGRIRGVIVAQGSFDGDGMSVVPLDEVRVVTVHLPQQLHHTAARDGVQHPAELGGFPQEVRRHLAQLPRSIGREKRLHSCRILVKLAELSHRSWPSLWPVTWPVSTATSWCLKGVIAGRLAGFLAALALHCIFFGRENEIGDLQVCLSGRMPGVPVADN